MESRAIPNLENRRFVLRSRPATLAGPENFALERVPLPAIASGEALVRIEMVALSVWQGMRTKDFKNFVRPFDIGELISCDSYARVVESRCTELPVGTAVVGRQGWQDYAVIRPEDVSVAAPEYTGEEWLTALSSPGQTPYLAFSQKVRPMPGETLVVTSAAGALGSYAVQLGGLCGARVVGIAGGSRKRAFVRDQLGADAAIDYRSDSFAEDLAAACPEGVHLYFDTVGGPTADIVSEQLAKRSHILLVGRVSANNSEEPERDMANLRHVWSQEATIHSFSRYAYKAIFAEVSSRLGMLLRAGRLTMYNHLIDGMEETPKVLHDVLAGRYTGKVLVRYADSSGTPL